MTAGPTPQQAADAFDQAFRAAYATFHRRDGVTRGLSGASRAALTHLAMTGPLTVGDAARHLARSQSTTSELLDQLEGNGLVERRTDPDDGRRTLVWLTAAGIDTLRRDESVLGLDLLAEAFAALTPAQRARATAALHTLTDAATHPAGEGPDPALDDHSRPVLRPADRPSPKESR